MRWNASCTSGVGARIRYARFPQQVLEGEGRGTLDRGVGVVSLPRGRAVFATVGFGSMCAGLVPAPNAMDHRLSEIDPGDARGARTV